MRTLYIIFLTPFPVNGTADNTVFQKNEKREGMAKRVGMSRDNGRGRKGWTLTAAVTNIFEFVRLAEFEILFFLFLIIAFIMFKDLVSFLFLFFLFLIYCKFLGPEQFANLMFRDVDCFLWTHFLSQKGYDDKINPNPFLIYNYLDIWSKKGLNCFGMNWVCVGLQTSRPEYNQLLVKKPGGVDWWPY